MLSRPYVNASIVLHHSSLAYERYIEHYARDEYFKDVYETLVQVPKWKNWITRYMTNCYIILVNFVFYEMKECM